MPIKNYLDQEDKEDKESFPCSYCISEFEDLKTLRSHVKRNHYCNICDKHFADLKIHNEDKHPQKKEFCEFCNKSYVDLKTHNRLKHYCSICDQHFTDLKSHNADKHSPKPQNNKEIEFLKIELSRLSNELNQLKEKKESKPIEIPKVSLIKIQIEKELGIDSNWTAKGSMKDFIPRYADTFGKDKFAENKRWIALYCRLRRSSTNFDDLIDYLNKK